MNIKERKPLVKIEVKRNGKFEYYLIDANISDVAEMYNNSARGLFLSEYDKVVPKRLIEDISMTKEDDVDNIHYQIYQQPKEVRDALYRLYEERREKSFCALQKRYGKVTWRNIKRIAIERGILSSV